MEFDRSGEEEINELTSVELLKSIDKSLKIQNNRWLFIRSIVKLASILMTVWIAIFLWKFIHLHPEVVSSEFVVRAYNESVSKFISSVDSKIEPTAVVIQGYLGEDYQPIVTTIATLSGEDVGKLSAKEESNGHWGVIGHDRTGGWSYGKYQVATKTGTFKNSFMPFVKENDEESHSILLKAGGSSGALKAKKKFVLAWRNLSSTERFRKTQHNYIVKTHYKALVIRVMSKGVDIESRSFAIRSVVFSVSVQHGSGWGCRKKKNKKICSGGASIIARTVKAGLSDSQIISNIYKERSRYFGSSTARVRASVLKRFKREERNALNMLNGIN